MDEIIIFIFIVIVVIIKSSEILLTAKEPVMTAFKILSIELTVHLKWCFSRFGHFWTLNICFNILLLTLFLIRIKIALTNSLMWWIIQQISCKWFQFGQDVSRPWDSFVIFERFVAFCVHTDFNRICHWVYFLVVVFYELVLEGF